MERSLLIFVFCLYFFVCKAQRPYDTTKCYKIFEGYAYRVFQKGTDSYQVRTADFFFSNNLSTVGSCADFIKLGRYLLLNERYYEDVNMLRLGSNSFGYYYSGKEFKKIELKECTINIHRVIITGYVNHESISNYTDMNRASHQHSIYDPLLDTKQTSADILYPVTITAW